VIWLVALAAALPLGMPLARAGAWAVGAMASYFYTSWVQNWGDPTWLERLSITVAIMVVPALAVTIWSGVRAARHDRPPVGAAAPARPLPEA
jgi:Mn2+/Fe2+ NRAMP family transporter